MPVRLIIYLCFNFSCMLQVKETNLQMRLVIWIRCSYAIVQAILKQGYDVYLCK